MAKVFFTRDISPEGLVRLFETAGAELKGKTAVKISTGEPGGHNFLQPALIKDLVNKLEGVSDSVKATSVRLTAELEGKRYDTITVECAYNVVIEGKSYYVAMTLEFEYDYDERFEISAPADKDDYSDMTFDNLI